MINSNDGSFEIDNLYDGVVKNDILSELKSIGIKNENKLYNNVNSILKPMPEILIPSDNGSLVINPTLNRESLHNIISDTRNNVIKTFLKEEDIQTKNSIIKKIIDNVYEIKMLEERKNKLTKDKYHLLTN